MPTDHVIDLADFADAFVAAAHFHSSEMKRDRELLDERLIPAIIRAAEYGSASEVAHIAKQIRWVVDHG